jgi:acyl-coenzyme A synthetase/AMP-(fatty) acid ligase
MAHGFHLNTRSNSPLSDRNPAEIIAFQNGREISAGEFLEQAKALSGELPDHPFVFNLYTDRYQYLLGFCAAVIAGQCTLMPPNRLAKTLKQLAKDYPDSYLLEDFDGYGQAFLSENYRCRQGETERDVPLIPENQLCAVAFTSGSTGVPSPNLKYWKTIRVSSAGNAQLLLENSDERINVLATVPPQHMWGFETTILLPLFADVGVSAVSPFYPQDIADALESLASPRALVSSPAHLRVLLDSGVQLVELDRIFSATAPMTMELARQLESRFGTSVLEIFGSSESGILARRRTATESLWRLSDLFEIELIKDGVLIRAQHLPAEVVLHDVIEKVDKDHFRWMGRHQDMVNIAGKKGSLTDLNRRLLAIDGVEDGVIFTPDNNSERLSALVVSALLKPADILRELKSEIESVFLPRPVLLVSALPRQETGKLARADVLRLHAEAIRAKKSGKQE